MEILVTDKLEEYELLDSGEGEKLERFGRLVLRRPENQAIWKKGLPAEMWDKASATFTHGEKSGRWKKESEVEEEWKMNFSGFKFNLTLLPSKHVGVFPEQSQNWKWLEEKIKNANHPIKVLNLFANTGGATLACCKANAEVVHLDSSKFSIDFAKKNLKINGMEDAKVRFIIDDARKFVEREIKRGGKYDVIILDPPIYGKGGKGEVWKIEKDLLPLVVRLREVLSNNPVAILLNGYSSIYSSLSYAQILSNLNSGLGGVTVFGELCIKESSKERLLSSGIFARWSKEK